MSPFAALPQNDAVLEFADYNFLGFRFGLYVSSAVLVVWQPASIISY
jgi:hypothetical protein